MNKKPPTILIVEDDEGHALLIRQNLEEAGLTNVIRHFHDGQEAVDFFVERMAFDHPETFLILLDIRMPKLDGVQVLKWLKANPNLARIPVIMLTTTDDPREVERCYELGCNVYVQKPVNYEKFADAIRRLGQFVSTVLLPVVHA